VADHAISKNGPIIRLTDERWGHIADEHAEMRDARDDVLLAIGEPRCVSPLRICWGIEEIGAQ